MWSSRSGDSRLDVLVPHVAFGGTEMIESGGHVASVPRRDGVQHQPDGVGLVLLSLVVGLTQLPAVAVGDLPGQCVAGLATVELQQDAPPLRLVVEVGQ